MIRPIVPPTVPPGSERVRICLHAGNTTTQVDGLCRVIGQWLQHQQETNSKEGQHKLKEHQVHPVSKLQEPGIDKARL